MDARQLNALWSAVLAGDAQQVARLLLPHSETDDRPGDRVSVRTARTAQVAPHVTKLSCSRSHLLHVAVECGDAAILALLLAHGNVSIDTPLKGRLCESEPRHGYSPLMLAASIGAVAMMRVLLAHGAQVEYPHQLTPLMVAISSGSVVAVHLLLEHGADAERTGGCCRDRALSFAVRYNEDTEILRVLLDHGVQVDARIHRHKTALHIAALIPKPKFVDLLIAHGADVSARGYKDRTALHGAAENDFAHVVQVLIAEGADVDATDAYGKTALHRAALHSCTRTLTALLAHGASVLLPDGRGSTSLYFAAKSGEIDAVRVILDAHGVCEELVNSVDLLACVLDGALEQDHEGVVSMVLEKLHQATTSGRLDPVYRRTLFIALQSHKWRIAKLLAQVCTSLDTPDHEGMTLLCQAVDAGDLLFVQLLLENGASASSPEPLRIAYAKGFAEIVNYLLHRRKPPPACIGVAEFDPAASDEPEEVRLGRHLPLVDHFEFTAELELHQPDSWLLLVRGEVLESKSLDLVLELTTCVVAAIHVK